MAIFQPTFQRKTIIDDTQNLTITIETSQKIDDHTVRNQVQFLFVKLFVFICDFVFRLGVHFKSSKGSKQRKLLEIIETVSLLIQITFLSTLIHRFLGTMISLNCINVFIFQALSCHFQKRNILVSNLPYQYVVEMFLSSVECTCLL